MFLKNHFLLALFGIGAVLISGNARAQSADSAMLGRPQLGTSQSKDSTKAQTKTIRIACASTIPAGYSPLYIVDGKSIQEEDIKSLNPNDIEKIEILKGNAATAIYGSRGANGVILVTLKHPYTKPMHQQTAKKGRLD
ncbi:TonB-dependent receptor plug domain-containing protein [Microvirga sp. STS02]|uniref:TonB-dependent receptor plug domain-containing protein n=1 Tax=Hymenobacter negativus TaxID=2795026 RepID=UPI0018DD8D3A|nr:MULTISPECIES: TonB-dependent receptor plug domain-containing protein [Bacteria]MBH8569459.1 TonB-dependent receptor plug domain-containing protein [Hymenobacter negativus]MBR7209195.1 TonB-dependent receptor plug domain-containing protein [Microvirga sp. STS02]